VCKGKHYIFVKAALYEPLMYGKEQHEPFFFLIPLLPKLFMKWSYSP